MPAAQIPAAQIPAAQIPAGWYPDPSNAAQQRWWDGAQWTEHVSAPAYAAPAAAPAYGERVQPAYAANPYTATAQPLRAPEGIDLGTAWIWLLAIVPVLPLLALLLIDWNSIFAQMMDPRAGLEAQFAIYTNPGYLLATLGGWIAYAVSIVLAYLDFRELRNRGVPQPFHWAWTFLSYLVTVIGRGVVIKRRTGRSYSGPTWLAIGGVVLSMVVLGVMTATMITAIISMVGSYR